MTTVYLKSHTEPGRVVELLEKLQADKVVLVVPKTSEFFQDPVGLKSLKQKAEALNTTVIIATTNPGARRLAQNLGFKVVIGRSLPKLTKKQMVSDALRAGEKVSFLRRFGLASSGSSRPRLTKGLLAGVSGLLVLLALAFFVLPEATIAVDPRDEPVTRDMEIRVDVNQKQTDISNLAVPGSLTEKELEGERTFTPTGRRNIGKKASGFIQFYNLSTNTLILKAETTRAFIDGREYAFTQDVSGLRPTAFIGQGEERTVDETSLIAPVPVIAAQAGEEYNLAEGSRVEIRNEVLGHQPEVLYGAAVSGGVAGGTTEEIRVVTEADLTEARNNLINGLAQEEGEFLPGAFEAELVSFEASHPAGSEAEQFTAQAAVRVRALGFDQADVLEVIRERIVRLLPENKGLAEGAVPVFDAKFLMVNLEQGSGILAAHYEAQAIYKISREDIASRVSGKSADEIGELLLSRPEIEAVQVNFRPFWVKKAPRLESRIRVVEGVDR